MPEPPVLAVDIGGTKVAAALVDNNGGLHRRREVPTPADAGAEVLWTTVAELARDVCADGAPPGIGIGCGGPMRWPEGIVSPLNIPGWREFPLLAAFRELFPGIPVRLHNDAIATAVAEHWMGAGRGTRSFLGIVVSTGVGGGLVIEHNIVSGPTGNAGHLGHVVVEPHGPPCACGGRGCAEAVARGPAIAAWAREQGWSGEPTARAVAEAAHRGDPVALAALARAGQAVGVAVASAAALLDLDAVAVGGGVAQSGDPFFGPLREAFERHARLSFTRRCVVGPAHFGRDAGLVGAAGLVVGGYWPEPAPASR